MPSGEVLHSPRNEAGLIGLGFAQLSFPRGIPRAGSSVCCVWCVTKTAATRDSPGQPSTALMPVLVKDLKYLPQKKKKIEERKWKNRRKNPQAIPIFDLFPAASTDLIQGSTAPHRAPHSTSGVSSLPWQPAQDGAVTLREPYLKGSKTLQGKCQKREVSVQDIPPLKTEPQRQQ